MKIGVAGRPKPGEIVSGDAYFCGEIGDSTIVCLVDGIGHGEEGHNAAAKLVEVLEQNKERSASTDPKDLIERCHEELRGTRGAVVGIAVIHKKSESLSFAGIGNISAVVVETNGAQGSEPPRHLISVGGIVGYNLRKVKQFECSYRGSDALVMFTDGVSSRFTVSDYVDERKDPQEIAETILREHGKDSDDATVLIVEK